MEYLEFFKNGHFSLEYRRIIRIQRPVGVLFEQNA
jgi:hypothetical protein